MTTADLPVPDIAYLRLAEHAERLDALAAAVEVLTGRVSALAEGDAEPGRGYSPIPAPRWWLLEDEERAAAVARLTAWVEQVLRPAYGHLGAVAPCWPEHTIALVTLDWLSELHSVLYLQPRRTASALAGQAEWQTRILPAAVDQLKRETTGCSHGHSAIRRAS